MLVILAGLLWAGPATATVAPPTAAELRAYKAAFQAIGRDDWADARRHAGQAHHPLGDNLIAWQDYLRPRSGASFEAIALLLAETADWPDRALLRRRAEEAMTGRTPAPRVIAWFARHPPLTADGAMRYAAALIARGQQEAASEVVRRAWVERDFGVRQERGFLRRYHHALRAQDHLARLERLLWQGREAPARRVMLRVDADHQALAEARLRLRTIAWGVDAAIAKVPAHLKRHPGLVYERLRWRRIKGRDESARELLWDPPAELGRPALWWTERAIQIRRALADGHISEAYRLARGHRQTGGIGYADGEWLAGWIVLRFLGDHTVAYGHFRNMAQRVRSSVSRARAGYWLGRAAMAMGRAVEAEVVWRAAARYRTTYYGQLAAARIGPPGPVPNVARRPPSGPEIVTFERAELVRAVRLLGTLDAGDVMDPILLRLGAIAETAQELRLVAGLAVEEGRPHLAVRLAKSARRRGFGIGLAGYPGSSLVNGAGPEVALVLAMIRQESAFDPAAVSHAGARGLMQLMPATARIVARQINVRYARDRLLGDPRYNVKLGQAYITGLLEEFEGSYVLALAAYNAGPHRARRWIRENGDPRAPDVDVVDWIESIPFSETCDYVQRVLEGLQMYRRRAGSVGTVAAIEGDLARGRSVAARLACAHARGTPASC